MAEYAPPCENWSIYNASTFACGVTASTSGGSSDVNFIGTNLVGTDTNVSFPSGVDNVLLGYNSGGVSEITTSDSVAIGHDAREIFGTGAQSVAIGSGASRESQGTSCVSVGFQAGRDNQGNNAVAVGTLAGLSNQAVNAIAHGSNAGGISQGSYGIAVGDNAGNWQQATHAVAVGRLAGATGQGQYSIAVGYGAGQTSCPADAIVINGGSTALSPATSGLFINPIQSSTDFLNVLQYNTTTSEITYGTAQTADNTVVNGKFDVWQRGVGSFTATGYTADQWALIESGNGSASITQESFALGQTDVPRNPVYHMGMFTDAVTVTANLGVLMNQRIENVANHSGETIDIRFYAKSDNLIGGGMDLSVEMIQNFGTGGSPSAPVTGIVTKLTTTTAWAEYVVTAVIPTVFGKTMGTNNNDYLGLVFWTSAGTDFDARTDTLGPQTGDMNLANISITPTGARVSWASLATEWSMCKRYYEIGACSAGNFESNGTNSFNMTSQFGTEKRVIPTVTLSNQRYDTGILSVTVKEATTYNTMLNATVNATNVSVAIDYSASAEL